VRSRLLRRCIDYRRRDCRRIDSRRIESQGIRSGRVDSWRIEEVARRRSVGALHLVLVAIVVRPTARREARGVLRAKVEGCARVLAWQQRVSAKAWAVKCVRRTVRLGVEIVRVPAVCQAGLVALRGRSACVASAAKKSTHPVANVAVLPGPGTAEDGRQQVVDEVQGIGGGDSHLRERASQQKHSAFVHHSDSPSPSRPSRTRSAARPSCAP